MIYSIQKTLWACVLAGGLANAEIWESTISLIDHYDYNYVWFDTTNRTMTTEYNDELVADLVMAEKLKGFGTIYYALVSFKEFIHYKALTIGADDFTSSNEILFIKDTALLDFSDPLPLNVDYYQKNILLRDETTFEYIYFLGFGLDFEMSYNPHTQENFLFQTHSGYYALCHLTLIVDRDEHGVLSESVPIFPHQLTCAVQTDGTTKFDSLPWHPDPVSVLPSVRSRKLKPSNTGLYYGANGARIHSPHRRVWQVLGE